LDWETATIFLPLDRYGLTPRESQIVDVAGSIEFARCVNQTNNVPSEAAQEAVRYLTTIPMVSHWLYGWWDVTYIAQFGYHGISDPPLAFSRDHPERAPDCIIQVQNENLTTTFNGNDSNSDLGQLAKVSLDAYDQTMANASFRDLQSNWRDCARNAGYVVETEYDSSAIHVDDSWSEEQVLQAALVEAQCADDMGYTQQVADIEAAYQTQYISGHEAELAQIRKNMDERVAQATQILKDAGIM